MESAGAAGRPEWRALELRTTGVESAGAAEGQQLEELKSMLLVQAEGTSRDEGNPFFA